MTNLTINYERAQRVKFTFPWYEGGLRVAVNTNVQKSPRITWGRYVFLPCCFLP
ncbi:MAG: hypothetical protein LBJ35_03790 [Spirochaetaceae bacterium]|nr:hypothetical protein [Spirochaetaceae bacterium]